MNVKLESTSIQLSIEQNTLNRLKLSGTVCFTDKPTDGIPGGCDVPLVLTQSAVEASVATLIHMPINCNWEDQWWGAETVMTDHGNTNIGVVTNASVEGNEVKVDALIYSFDNPDIAYFIKNCVDSLGFSVEAMITKSHTDDTNIYADELTFTGVAMLMKKCAAFQETYVSYIAAKNKNNKSEVNNMNEDQMKALLGSFMEQMKESIEGVKAELSAQTKESNDKVEALAVSLAEVKEQTKVEPVAPVVTPVVQVQASAQPVVEPVVDPVRQTSLSNVTSKAKYEGDHSKLNAIWASNKSDVDKFAEAFKIAKDRLEASQK